MRNHRLRRNQSCFWQPISGPLAHQHTKRARTKCNIMIINYPEICNIYRNIFWIRLWLKHSKIMFQTDMSQSHLAWRSWHLHLSALHFIHKARLSLKSNLKMDYICIVNEFIQKNSLYLLLKRTTFYESNMVTLRVYCKNINN